MENKRKVLLTSIIFIKYEKGDSKMTDTTIINIDLAGDIKSDILFNSDVVVPDAVLAKKIMGTPDRFLMRIVNTIGSHKKIISADVIDDDFLTKNLIKEH